MHRPITVHRIDTNKPFMIDVDDIRLAEVDPDSGGTKLLLIIERTAHDIIIAESLEALRTMIMVYL